MPPCGLFFSSRFSHFYANPIWLPITSIAFSLTLSHGQIWSSLSQALTFMFPLQRLFSATNALLFCPFPRFPGLVFARSRRYVAIYLLINPGPSSAPLFSVLSGSGLEPITYKHFSGFLSLVASRLQLGPSRFSPHSFRRGGATFAFDRHVPSELIKLQGDWQSDAYLVFLELSQQ